MTVIGKAPTGRDTLMLFLDTSFHITTVLGFFSHFLNSFSFSERSKIMVFFPSFLAFWSFYFMLVVAQLNLSSP